MGATYTETKDRGHVEEDVEEWWLEERGEYGMDRRKQKCEFRAKRPTKIGVSERKDRHRNITCTLRPEGSRCYATHIAQS